MKRRIGIVGGGQLGRMLAFQAKRLGFHVTVLDPTAQSPAGQVSDEQIIGDFKDENAIKKLAEKSDFLTFEIELANAHILEELAKQGIQVNPSAKTLEIIKDKFRQKEFLKQSKIPTADFIQVETKEDILNATKRFNYPILLKARFDAYDGRGNALIKSAKDIDIAMKKLEGRKLYVEEFVPFAQELAVIVARSTEGEIKTFPVVETIHKNNICHIVIAPPRFSEKAQKNAQKLATKVMQQLKGAGVFGIEMFLTKNDDVLINEIAPRVHNSGHLTIESCTTSQFEQHIRAVTGLPLGNTDMIVPAAVMINILGERNGPAEIKGLDKALQLPNVAVHIYGKADTRMERKMGHITAIDVNVDRALQKAKKARALMSI